ncbi:MAG: sigma-70 family RNA polymerase sigma factor [Phycisphaerae bacterium]|nr:sigma-70 family RNA polymerase sigma factor [Phycisphaerae bacterium]
MTAERTSLTLLAGLRDPANAEAWQRFDALYRPMLVRFGLRLGLDPTDADEAAQRTSVSFCKAYQQGQYDPDKGKFRNWLFGIARHEICDLHTERAKQPISPGQRSSIADALSLLSDPDSLTKVWDREWQEYVLSVCLRRAKQNFTSRDMRIFELLTLNRLAVKQVAQDETLSPDAVFKIKHRVLKFMSQVKVEVEGAV